MSLVDLQDRLEQLASLVGLDDEISKYTDELNLRAKEFYAQLKENGVAFAEGLVTGYRRSPATLSDAFALRIATALLRPDKVLPGIFKGFTGVADEIRNDIFSILRATVSSIANIDRALEFLDGFIDRLREVPAELEALLDQLNDIFTSQEAVRELGIVRQRNRGT